MEKSGTPNNKWIGGSGRASIGANFKWILCKKMGQILMSVFMRVESHLGNKLLWTSLTINGVGDLGCYWKALLLEVGDWQQIQRSKPQAFFPFLTHERSMSTYALLFVECNTHTTPNREKIKCQGILALGWRRSKWSFDSSFFFGT